MTDSTFDPSYRPASYFGPQRLEDHFTSRIAGAARRRLVARALAAGEDVPAALLGGTLDPATRDAFARSDPSLLGGEFLPEQRRDEVEIARISLASITNDQVVVRARRAGQRLRYSVHDEYDGEFVNHDFRPRSSKRPLTFRQLVRLIDSAYDVLGVVDENVDGGADVDRMRTFVTVTSDFYPELERFYAEMVDAWIDERHAPEEPEGDEWDEECEEVDAHAAGDGDGEVAAGDSE